MAVIFIPDPTGFGFCLNITNQFRLKKPGEVS